MMNGQFSWGPILFFSYFILSTVRSLCLNGNEKGCVWTHDESQPLRWAEKKDSNDQWVEVTKCTPPCGKAVLMSPWLPPRDQGASWMLKYKLYGFQTVTVQLSMKTEDSGPTQLFFEKGNYADTYPEFWKASKVILPPVDQKHRLLLEAVAPFKDALVAVADVTTKAAVKNSPIPSETKPRKTPVEAENPNPKEVVELEVRTVEPTSQIKEIAYPKETQTVEPTSQIKEIAYSTETQTDSNKVENEEEEEEDRYGALEAGFGGDPDLRRGYTIMMDPNICMYP